MQAYIDTWTELAISQMVEHGVPASITLAQAIYESRCGGSDLAKASNNHFGIKCHLEWRGDTVLRHDDTLYECFRSYAKIEDSYEDHSLFLSKRPRYAALFELPNSDFRSWCRGLKEAGYATYEQYAEELIRLIEQTELYKLDGVRPLSPRSLFSKDQGELRVSSRKTSSFALRDYTLRDMLFSDELYAHPRSLQLIVRQNKGLKRG